MASIQSILFVAFPNVGEQDLLAPWELFRSVAFEMNQRGEKLDVVLGSFEEGPVRTQMGTTVQPGRTITAADRFDLVYVPGGIGAGIQDAWEDVFLPRDAQAVSA